MQFYPSNEKQTLSDLRKFDKIGQSTFQYNMVFEWWNYSCLQNFFVLYIICRYRYIWSKNDVISSVKKHIFALGLGLVLRLGLRLG